jgi:hypothetical protein
MARTIQAIFIDPPIAVARLGGSNAPQDAYRWVEAVNPRSDGSTVIAPWWTLDVLGDATVEPRMPTSIRLRDGDLIRPVAPFFEIWALVGEPGSPPSQWREEPLTPKLLQACRTDESALTIQIDAKNRKVARRMVDDNLVFGTFPPLVVRGDDHSVQTLRGTSPPDAPVAMIPDGQLIPLGTIQVLRSRDHPKDSGAEWENAVNVEVIRFRYVPARGRFYGPPEAAVDTGKDKHGIAVDEINAFLDPEAGWFNRKSEQTIEPPDTYDTMIPETNAVEIQPSLGVIDDTCEARVTVTLTLPGKGRKPHVACANIFVGPPDFAPDRRPFLSAADELQDRGSGAAERNAALSDSEREKWVQDLFERIYETVSLFNLDNFQSWRGVILEKRNLRKTPLRGDHVAKPPKGAMTNRDKLRTDSDQVPRRSSVIPLPLYELARTRHLSIQDIDELKALIDEHPDRLEKLIRQPFQVQDGETGDLTTMRMPPFMRNSNSFPLTLSVWQYDLLMQWVKSVRPARKRTRARAPKISRRASARLDRVLKRLNGQSS